jgi:hypothetical protein
MTNLMGLKSPSSVFEGGDFLSGQVDNFEENFT